MPNVNLHLQTLPSDIKQCFEKQDQNCKRMYYVIGFFLCLFLIWLIALSISKSRTGKEGERGPPGPAGPSGQTGATGLSKNEEMKNAKIYYITKTKDFSSSTTVKKRSGFVLGDENSNVSITLPHFSVIGNGATFYIFNQSPIFTSIVKAAKIKGEKPAQMSFSTGGTKLKLPPRQYILIVIMDKEYVVFSDYTKKPVLHWVNSWTNCGGIPKTNGIKLNSTKGYAIGPSLVTWGCKNYRKDMDVVYLPNSINVKNANTLGKTPKDVKGGVYVVHDPDGVQLPGTITQNIFIGTHKTNTKIINLPAQAIKASSKPVNKQNPTWKNKFKASVISNGTQLKVQRLDKNQGWGQQLILKVHFIASVA